jgi:hypothetical protein
VMPYDAYRLYQVERAKSSTGVQHADEQLGQLAAAASWLFRGITQPARAVWRPYPVMARGVPRAAEPADCRGAMIEAMEGS